MANPIQIKTAGQIAESEAMSTDDTLIVEIDGNTRRVDKDTFSDFMFSGTPADVAAFGVVRPEQYSAVNDASADASADVSSTLTDALAQGKKAGLYGKYRLDSAVTLGMDGGAPGEHVFLEGSGLHREGINVNNATGGLFFQGTGVARQHTVQMRDLHFNPMLADSGYPFKVEGLAGGLSNHSALILDRVYCGPIGESYPLDFTEGPSITGVFRPVLTGFRLTQSNDDAITTKWPHVLDFTDCYGVFLYDVWCNVAAATNDGVANTSGAHVGIKCHGTDEESFTSVNTTINGADIGLDWLHDGRQPGFEWYGGHINFRHTGMRLNGIKFGFVHGALMYANDIAAGAPDTVDFRLEDVDGMVFRDVQFRSEGNSRRHFWLEPKAGKAGAVVRNVDIYLGRGQLFAETNGTKPIYCNGATKVVVHVPENLGSDDFVDYPTDLVEMGPNQDPREITIVTPIGLISMADDGLAGPTIKLDRQSPSPVGGDRLGALIMRGRNAAGEGVDYGRIGSTIIDTVDGAEDGRVIVSAMIDGTMTEVAQFNRAAVGGNTGLLLLVNDSGTQTLQAVTVGANNTGDTGYRVLQVPNA